MDMRKTYIAAALLAMATAGGAKNIYVSTTGSDSNAGTIDSPLASLGAAQQKAAAGDTVYFRGGTYHITEDQVMGVEENILITETGNEIMSDSDSHLMILDL